MDIYEKIVELKCEGKELAIATVIETVGASPGKLSFKMIILKDGETFGTVGGGALEHNVIEKGKEVIKTGESALLSYSLDDRSAKSIGMVCGGTIKVFIEYVGKRPSLYIFGAGHIGYYLSLMADLTGFDVYMVDDREDMLNNEKFKHIKGTFSGDFKSTIKEIDFKNNSFYVLVSASHETDEEILRELLLKDIDFRYLGMIGSKMKVLTVFKNLIKEGINEDKFKNINAPIGLDIEAQTPQEIAISILAELISVRYGKDSPESIKNKAKILEKIDLKK